MRKKRVLVMVPGQEGGIDRLFEHLNIEQSNADSAVHIQLFRSHGNLFRGIVLFPFRLLVFTSLGLSRRFDLCHLNVSLKGSTLRKIVFGNICKALGIPYIIHLHGASYDKFYRALPKHLAAYTRNFFQKSSNVIVLGSVWRNFVIKEFQVNHGRVTILPNAVFAPETLPPRDEKASPHILFLGRLGERKGVPELLQALASPEMKALTWSATLAGDGDVALYRAQAQSLGVGDRVVFPGWVGPQDVQQLLQTAHILALPSHAENLPLSMLEGMGYGLCPVVTPVGAVTEVIRDGENGLLVPVGDAKALAGALVEVIDNPQKRQRLARQARTDFEANYDIRNYREKLEAIYLDVIGTN